MVGRRSAFAAAALLATFASQTRAQIFSLDESTRRFGLWSFEVGGQMAEPLGGFRSSIDRAWGFGGSVRRQFRSVPALRLRVDGAWLNYGNEKKTVPLSPTLNRVVVDMHTLNNIALVTGGPELALPAGPVRPYVHAFAGYSYFYTQSSADGNDGTGSFASSTNFDDGGWTKGWGLGVRIPASLKTAEAALDVGGRRTFNGVRTYLRHGDIVDQPDGSLLFTPRTTTADFWQYHIAISVTPRRGR